MHDKSSTSLAIISVLSIVIVLFIAISNVEEAPVRKPFSTSQAGSGAANSGQAERILPPFIEQKIDQTTDPDNFAIKFPDFVEGVMGGQTQTETPLEAHQAEEQLPVPELEPLAVEISPENRAAPEGGLTGGINSEELTRAGYSDFVIKPRPFNGLLFDQFDVSMLSYLDVVDKRVLQMENGFENEVLHVYQFSFSESDGAREIYDYLKTDLKDELGVKLNETNQFGLGSFYVNFETPRDSVFLVVKTKYNVYALSYPKDDEDGDGNFKLVSSLLSELI
jgi:hypothetical protein